MGSLDNREEAKCLQYNPQTKSKPDRDIIMHPRNIYIFNLKGKQY